MTESSLRGKNHMDDERKVLKWAIRSQALRIVMMRSMSAVQRVDVNGRKEELITLRLYPIKVYSGHPGNLVEQPLMQLVAYGA